MQYLLMCCFAEERWEALPEAERGRIMAEYAKCVDDMKRSGHYLAGAKLAGSARAITVRAHNGQSTVTSGPFAETREQLGGYHLVECRDVDEAVALAKRIPTLASGGTIEVRAVLSSP